MAEHPPEFTPMDMPAVRASLSAAFRDLMGDPPTPRELATMAAHVDLETAGGRKMRGYNFGNVTGKANGHYFLLKAPELIDGVWRDVEQPYRWYPNPLAGAADYVAFLRRRYPTAFAALNDGPRAFARALKEGEPYAYYTAPLDRYAATLQRRYITPDVRRPPSLVPLGLLASALAFVWWKERRS